MTFDRISKSTQAKWEVGQNAYSHKSEKEKCYKEKSQNMW